ncbi:Dipeptidyl peptidase 8 [Halotydeus destructor]|nr:Dipeptidyl peptidase 8 [Halotydeus destructor]
MNIFGTMDEVEKDSIRMLDDEAVNGEEEELFQDMEDIERSNHGQARHQSIEANLNQLIKPTPSASSSLFRPFDIQGHRAEFSSGSDSGSSDLHNHFRRDVIPNTPTTWHFNILPQSFPSISVAQFRPNLTNILPANLTNLTHNFTNNIGMPSMPSFSVPSMPNIQFSMPSIPSMPSMPSLPSLMSAKQRKSWSELKESVRLAHKRLAEVSSRVPLQYRFRTIDRELADGSKSSGVRIYFLCPPANSTEAIIHYCDVYDCDYQAKLKRTGSVSDSDSANHQSQSRPREIRSPSSASSYQDPESPSFLSPSPPTYSWHPLIELRFKRSRDTVRSEPSNVQEKLQLERKRIMSSGITDYVLDDKLGRFIFASSGSLFYFDDNGQDGPPYWPTRLESFTNAAKINPTINPSNGDLIAFVSQSQVCVVNVRTGQEIVLTNVKMADGEGVSSGLPSYVIQEEFRRYEGIWWRPESEYVHLNHNDNGDHSSNHNLIRYDLLYEEVDESDVELFRISSWDGNIEEYHFPRPGEANATSRLKMASFYFDSKTNLMVDSKSDKFCPTVTTLDDYLTLSAAYEYLVRVGWLSHDVIWVQLLNRKQTNLVIGLISVSGSFPAQVIYEEASTSFWLNVTDILHFLGNHKHETLTIGSTIEFIWASEETSFRHLYLIKSTLSGGGDQVNCQNDHDASDKASASPPKRMSPGSYQLNHNDRPNQAEDAMVSEDSHTSPVCSKNCLNNRELRSVVNCKRQLTSGNWEISDRDVWVDEAKKLVYFVALKEIPLERHLYVVSFSNLDIRTNSPVRLTDSGHSHTTIAFEPNQMNYFVNIQSNISTPPYGYVNKIDKLESKGSTSNFSLTKRKNSEKSSKANSISLPRFEKMGLIVTNNFVPLSPSSPMGSPCSSPPPSLTTINDRVDLLPGLPKPELFTYQLRNSNDLVYGVIFKPEFMENGVKYPVVLDIYGGPEVQIVSNSFKGVRHVRRHLLASEGYIVCAFDCRGSHHRGKHFEGHLHKRMGQVEIADQAEVLSWLAENTGYMDMKRVAVHGWSYGGYLSLMALGQRPDLFKLAIAGAPVVKWSIYDSGYTERYMGTPHENPEGYSKGSVLNYISNFPNDENRLLIIHGLMDENVHFAHSVELINALIKAGKPYQLQVYPYERHSLRSGPCCEHYETFLLSYLQQHL